MRLFRVVPDASDRTRSYEIDAAHRFSLPGLECDVCKATWATTGLAYPQVELPASIDPGPYTSRRPVPIRDFDALVDRVRSLFPDELLQPGTGFGALHGRVRGNDYGDFAWLNPWTLLGRSERLKPLANDSGLLLIETDVWGAEGKADLIELYLPPCGQVSVDAEPCPRCGRVAASMPPEIAVTFEKGSAVPPPLFRIRNFPTLLIASESFVEAIARDDLSGVELKEIGVGQ